MARGLLGFLERGLGLVDWLHADDLVGCNCYIAQNYDEEVLANCASGGVFAAVATAFIEAGGVVFGAVYDDKMRVVHMAATSVDGIRRMQGSKYVQSSLGECFRSVEQYLRSGDRVLFSGAPCQIAGLYAFLSERRLADEELGRLYTIDFVCHGVGSPMVLDSYVAEEKEAGYTIASINMRSKYHGYRNSSMELVAENGKVQHISTKVDRYLGAFFSNCISRPSCHECAFKGIRRPSAITLWDSWNAEEVIGKKPDNKGYTNMIVRGEKGERLLAPAKAMLFITEVSFPDIAPVNGGMLANSCKANDKRHQFLNTVAAKGLKMATAELLPTGPRDYARELVKTMLWHLGLLDIVTRGKRAGKR